MYIQVPVIDVSATGKNIKSMRESSGMSVKDLQMIFGFESPRAIYKWQNGESIPSIDNLIVLKSIFGVGIDDIVVVR